MRPGSSSRGMLTAPARGFCETSRGLRTSSATEPGGGGGGSTAALRSASAGLLGGEAGEVGVEGDATCARHASQAASAGSLTARQGHVAGAAS